MHCIVKELDVEAPEAYAVNVPFVFDMYNALTPSFIKEAITVASGYKSTLLLLVTVAPVTVTVCVYGSLPDQVEDRVIVPVCVLETLYIVSPTFTCFMLGNFSLLYLL